MRPAALVTGGAVRLGRALALALADAGYDIALHFRSSTQAAAETQAQIRARGVACECFGFDLSELEGIEAFVARVRAHYPRLDVLINSASGYASGTIAETSPALLAEQLTLNLQAPFLLTRAFAAQVERGQIINVLDNKIGFHQFQYAAYLLGKKGLAELTKMAAMEFAPRLRVNAVAPGVTLPATERSPEYLEWRRQAIPLRRSGEPEHVAQAMLGLLANPFVTGQILTVDGGENLATVGRNRAAWPTPEPKAQVGS